MSRGKSKQNERDVTGPGETVRLGLVQRALAPVDAASTVVFRIVFGAVMLWEAMYHIRGNLVQERFLQPAMLFKYYGFEWVRVLRGEWEWVMPLLPWAVGAVSVFVMFGFLYRLSVFLLFVLWTYMFLLDQAVYINHFYLMSMVAGLMVFIPANRCYSMDARFFPGRAGETVPAWCVWIIRFLMGIVYFYAGIAKMNADWLGGHALMLILMDKTPIAAMHEPSSVLFFSWAGMLFDTLAMPALLWKRTRLAFFVFACSFHLFNWIFLFDIGSFPALAMGATSMFLSPSWPRMVVRGVRGLFSRGSKRDVPTPASGKRSAVVVRPYQWVGLGLLSVFALVQIALPLRSYLLYPSDPDWSCEGHRFSWRMMLNSRHVPMDQVAFRIVDPETGKSTPAGLYQIANGLQGWQMRVMLVQSDMLVQFGQYCDRKMRAAGYEREMYVRIPMSLNGRQPQLFMSDTVDITKLERSLWPYDWLMPMPTEAPPEMEQLRANYRPGT